MIMILSGVLMVVAAGMMVGQQEWTMLAVVLPIWLLLVGLWWYRNRGRY